MAGQDADLNLDLGEPAKKGKGKLFIIIGVAVVVLALGGAGAWYFLKGKKAGAGEAETHEAAAEQTTVQFIPLKDKFVVNIAGTNRDRVAQIAVSLMTRSPEADKAVEALLPLIRSSLVELFSVQKAEDLMHAEGKEKLREAAQKRVETVFKENKSEVKIDKVLFSDFVMQ